MDQPRPTKPTNKKPSRPKLRLSGDWSVVDKAVSALAGLRGEPRIEPLAAELGFCFIETTLGVLQVDVGRLLLLTGSILQHDPKASRKGASIEVELTEDVVDATAEIIKSVPRYIERDLPGMFSEAQFMLLANDVENPQLRKIGVHRPYTIEKLCKVFFARGEKRRIIHLKLLGELLAKQPFITLSIPEIAEAFAWAISEKGPVGPKPWRKFVEQHICEKRARGRRRDKLYDVLFERRTENAGLSYGKLAREVAKLKNIEFAVARDQVRAAIAYRRKKAVHNK
jgi:hypothetical protein